MMGASSDKTIRIFASVSNWGSEQCTGHQKKRSGTSHTSAGRHLSPPSRKLYLSGEVYARLAKQSCPTASKLRAFGLHACIEQSSPCLATAWK